MAGKVKERWKTRWENDPTCRQTKQFFPGPDENKSKRILKFARSQLSTLVEVTTGHNGLAYPASKEDPTLDPMCDLCDEAPETFYHFMTECPRLRQTRIDTGIECFDNKSWREECVLEFARIPAINALLNRI